MPIDLLSTYYELDDVFIQTVKFNVLIFRSDWCRYHERIKEQLNVKLNVIDYKYTNILGSGIVLGFDRRRWKRGNAFYAGRNNIGTDTIEKKERREQQNMYLASIVVFKFLYN